MATSDSTLNNSHIILGDACDILSEIRFIANFVQSISESTPIDSALILQQQQLQGFYYVMENMIDKIKDVEKLVHSVRDKTDVTILKATTDEAKKRAGAMAFMDALHSMKNEHSNGSDLKSWWKNEDEAIASMLHAAGKPEGFVAGFIAAMSEYIMADLMGCPYNLDTWRKPEAAMTHEEKAASRVSCEEAAHA